MMNNSNPGLLKTVIYTIMRVTGFILVFLLVGGPYYTLLENLFDVATSRGDAALTAWSNWVYYAFYYGFPSLMVFGIIVSIAYMFMVLRRRYYTSEEVYY